jgi:hypothetical protein
LWLFWLFSPLTFSVGNFCLEVTGTFLPEKCYCLYSRDSSGAMESILMMELDFHNNLHCYDFDANLKKNSIICAEKAHIESFFGLTYENLSVCVISNVDEAAAFI